MVREHHFDKCGFSPTGRGQDRYPSWIDLIFDLGAGLTTQTSFLGVTLLLNSLLARLMAITPAGARPHDVRLVSPPEGH